MTTLPREGVLELATLPCLKPASTARHCDPYSLLYSHLYRLLYSLPHSPPCSLLYSFPHSPPYSLLYSFPRCIYRAFSTLLLGTAAWNPPPCSHPTPPQTGIYPLFWIPVGMYDGIALHLADNLFYSLTEIS